MSVAWFWMEEGVRSGLQVLSSEESRHVVSRRLRVGDAVTAFDGAGKTASAKIEGLAKKAVEISVGDVFVAPPPGARLMLATAIPKGDRLGTFLQMATQLGLTCWQPLILEHSSVRRLDPDSPRQRRILIEACKVARRPWSMQVRPPETLDAVLDGFGRPSGDSEPGPSLYFGDLGGVPAAAVLASRSSVASSQGSDPAAETLESAVVFIGPEAGFSDSERTRLVDRGATSLSFSEFNLRIETAAVAAVAAFENHSLARREPT